MKKLTAITIIALLMNSIAYAGWDYTIKNVEQKAENMDTLTVTVVYSDGKQSITEEVPIFHPKDKSEVLLSIENRASTIAHRIEAEDRIRDVVKPQVEEEVNIKTVTEIR